MTDDKSVVRVESRSAPAAARFRYTGAGSLVVDGLFARNTYRFSAAARELMILGEDIAIMRGHPELIELRKSA
ncbi:MAG TPA: hypothetical protein VN643_11900 [Pyrinomonadaceae bacterium]|nr:hypothetical protein [Pyrinomonadaceae bacterium]